MAKEMSDLAKGIAAGLKSAIAHAKGKSPSGSIERIVMVPDAKAIREKLNMSQSEFASAYNIPLATLKGWEQRRRRLDTTAIAYLRTIARFPKETRRAQMAGTKTVTRNVKKQNEIHAGST